MSAVLLALIPSKLKKWLAIGGVVTGAVLFAFIYGWTKRGRQNQMEQARATIEKYKELEQIRQRQLEAERNSPRSDADLDRVLEDGEF